MFKNFTSLKLSRQKCDDPEKLKKCEKREKERMFRVYLFQILACVGFLRLPLLGDLGRRDGDRRLPQGLQIDLKKRQKRSVKTEIRLSYVFLFYIQWQIKSIARNEIIKSVQRGLLHIRTRQVGNNAYGKLAPLPNQRSLDARIWNFPLFARRRNIAR